MGSIFRAPKIRVAPASAETQAADAQARQAQQDLAARNEAAARTAEEQARLEREAFAAGLRGSRALLSGSQAGFSLPATLGGR